jgi:hypothetical protein
MSEEKQFTVPCAICNKPVVIGSKSAKANEVGKAVHEDCYLAEITGDEKKKS